MQVYAHDGRPLPLVTPVAQPFFDAARKHQLLLQKCPRDGFFFYPRSHCPHCLQTDWAWLPASTTGRIHAFTIDRIGQDPGQRVLAPLSIALVDLEAGPRLVGNMVGCTLEQIQVGMAVTVCFEVIDNTPLLRFRPV